MNYIICLTSHKEVHLLDIEILDINNDGFKDIIGVGNIYDSEVETIRYDASQGYVLLGNEDGKFSVPTNTGFVVNADMRAVSKINILGKTHVMVANNNDTLRIFRLN